MCPTNRALCSPLLPSASLPPMRGLSLCVSVCCDLGSKETNPPTRDQHGECGAVPLFPGKCLSLGELTD